MTDPTALYKCVLLHCYSPIACDGCGYCRKRGRPWREGDYDRDTTTARHCGDGCKPMAMVLLPLAPRESYDPAADLRGSVAACYETVKARVAKGGKGWGGYPK